MKYFIILLFVFILCTTVIADTHLDPNFKISKSSFYLVGYIDKPVYTNEEFTSSTTGCKDIIAPTPINDAFIDIQEAFNHANLTLNLDFKVTDERYLCSNGEKLLLTINGTEVILDGNWFIIYKSVVDTPTNITDTIDKYKFVRQEAYDLETILTKLSKVRYIYTDSIIEFYYIQNMSPIELYKKQNLPENISFYLADSSYENELSYLVGGGSEFSRYYIPLMVKNELEKPEEIDAYLALYYIAWPEQFPSRLARIENYRGWEGHFDLFREDVIRDAIGLNVWYNNVLDTIYKAESLLANLGEEKEKRLEFLSSLANQNYSVLMDSRKTLRTYMSEIDDEYLSKFSEYSNIREDAQQFFDSEQYLLIFNGPMNAKLSELQGLLSSSQTLFSEIESVHRDIATVLYGELSVVENERAISFSQNMTQISITNAHEDVLLTIRVSLIIAIITLFAAIAIPLWNERRADKKERLYVYNYLYRNLEKNLKLIRQLKSEIPNIVPYYNLDLGAWHLIAPKVTLLNKKPLEERIFSVYYELSHLSRKVDILVDMQHKSLYAVTPHNVDIYDTSMNALINAILQHIPKLEKQIKELLSELKKAHYN